MKKKDNSAVDAAPLPSSPLSQSSEAGRVLRRQAEEIVRKKGKLSTENLSALSIDEIRQTLHELQVHQIELEMQNEELRASQEELDAARARYFDLYDLAPVGYCTISKAGLILEANFTAATLLGNTRNALVKQPVTRFIRKEDQDVYYLHRRQLFETGEPQIFELQMVKKDGAPFWVRMEAAVAQDSDGAFVCRVVMSDISELKRVEVEKVKLEIQNRQLQKAKSLRRMAGAIAHHFNNQLQVVMGNLELTVMNLPQESAVEEYLTEAMEASRRAAEMSTLMLTYLGQTHGKHEPMDLSVVCRRSLPLLQATAPKGTLFKADFPAIGPVIHANPGQVMQILNNLITNAWESADESRRSIGLTAKTVTRANIHATKRFPVDWEPRDPAYACLEVADAGSGIMETDFEKIFDPFFSTKLTGRGLGLPVVLGIAQAHHGAVTVESELERGSIFRVFFPLSVEAGFRRPDITASPPEFRAEGTLLVVEDDETLAALRGLSPGIPFVLSSGYNEEQVMVGDHSELPQAFLGKPYRIEQLRDTIGRVLANKS